MLSLQEPKKQAIQYVYDGTERTAERNDDVFWIYNPNLFGKITRLEEDTFTVRWSGQGSAKKYPRHSWSAIGCLKQ